MKTLFDDLLAAFEGHSVECIRAILETGFDAKTPVGGKMPVNYLIEMYFRSDRLPECLRPLLERGATLDDPRIEPILLNDPVALETAVRSDGTLLEHRTSMVSNLPHWTEQRSFTSRRSTATWR